MSTALRLPSGGEESAEQRYFTPGGAAKLLKTNDDKTFVSHGVVQKYVREIQFGLWRQARHTVVLFPDGSVAAGHVYLQAVVKANIAACLFVEQAVERKVVDGSGPDQEDASHDDEIPRFVHDKANIIDKPGQFMMLDKHLINVDEVYQREVDDKRARGYSENFSWSAFGVASVAVRPDGTFWAFDAATRLRTAMYVETIREVPCMVYEFDDIPSESLAFERLNKHRKSVNAFDTYRSWVASRKPFALFTESLLQAHGYEAGRTSGRTVRCIVMMTDMAKQNKEVLAKVWPLVVALHDGSGIDKHVLAALYHLELEGEGNSILEAKWKKRLMALGSSGVARAAIKGQEFFGNASRKSWMTGVLNAINSGLPAKLRYRVAEEEK